MTDPTNPLEDFTPTRRFSLAGRRALVTGGSIGIGRAIALQLAGAGADVAIQYAPDADAGVDRPAAGAALIESITRSGRRGVAIAADFAMAGDARRTAEETTTALGGIDILVIAASIQSREPFAAVAEPALSRQIAVNFKATVELLQAVLPTMRAAGWGRVLSIGSVNQLRPDPELAVYAAMKAAQHNLIVNLAREYAPTGVTLNTLSPGLVATDRNRARREDADAWAAIERAANPMARAATPDEMAGAALLLCSPAGSFITGVDLPVAGGAQL